MFPTAPACCRNVIVGLTKQTTHGTITASIAWTTEPAALFAATNDPALKSVSEDLSSLISSAGVKLICFCTCGVKGTGMFDAATYNTEEQHYSSDHSRMKKHGGARYLLLKPV